MTHPHTIDSSGDADAGPDAAAEHAQAEYIGFDEFRNGLPHGRFRIIVNPVLAPAFVLQRTHAVALAVAMAGCGTALALAGYPIAGLLLITAGVLLRRTLRAKAGKVLLHLASTQPATYTDATAQGVMEVRRAT